MTGMSGTGKSSVINELRQRGHVTVDTDSNGCELPDRTSDEVRMNRLLAQHRDVVVSGTVENQGRFYDRFEHVVLLSAPLPVLLQRARARTRSTTTTTEYRQSVQKLVSLYDEVAATQRSDAEYASTSPLRPPRKPSGGHAQERRP